MGKKPAGIVARTQWHRVSPTRLRRCLQCVNIYPSTSAFDRRCPACLRLTSSSRARAALTLKHREILDYIDEQFDFNIVVKSGLAQRYDRRKHARTQLARLERRGEAIGEWAEELRREASVFDIFVEKYVEPTEEEAREERERLAESAGGLSDDLEDLGGPPGTAASRCAAGRAPVAQGALGNGDRHRGAVQL